MRSLAALLGLVALVGPPSLASASPSEPLSLDERGVARAAPRRAFLRVELTRRPLVVGESVPVVVRAYVLHGTFATFTGAPSVEGDAFAIYELVDRADVGRTEVDGAPYGTLTWRGRLTTLRAGAHPLRVTVPASLRWQERARVERADGRPSRLSPSGVITRLLGGLGRTRRARVTLSQRRAAVRVVEPPAEGRPADFAGAVGRFEIEAELSPVRARVGEPFTLRLVVRGEGSFERVVHPVLERAGVRTYPPTARFVARGGDGRRGTKTFEQAVVPLEPGPLELGALTLSFYDPAAAGYVTRSTGPLVIDVEPGEGRAYADLRSSAGAPPPLRARLGAAVPSLSPPLTDARWLLAPLGLMAAAVSGGVALARRDPRASAARRARRRVARACARARGRMRAAARRGDPEAFFAAARACAQQHLGALCRLTPEAITLAEAEARLAHVPDALRELFERADAIAFGGEHAAGEDLAAWRARLERALDEELNVA